MSYKKLKNIGVEDEKDIDTILNDLNKSSHTMKDEILKEISEINREIVNTETRMRTDLSAHSVDISLLKMKLDNLAKENEQLRTDLNNHSSIIDQLKNDFKPSVVTKLYEKFEDCWVNHKNVMIGVGVGLFLRFI